MAFSGSSDGRIARHQRDGVGRQRAQPDRAAESRRGPCGLDASVPRSDDDDIQFHYLKR